jgi:hypothetical protein
VYIQPLAGRGLFPLAEKGPDGKPIGTERDLSFEFKPGVNYFAKFDEILPSWKLEHGPYETKDGSHAAFSDAVGPIEMYTDERETLTISYRRYVRAIDPAGNLCQLIISSVRPSPFYPKGEDRVGTMMRVVATKSRRGWLVVEPVSDFWSPYAGKQGQEYAAWCWAVMEYRQKRHAAYEANEAMAFMSRAEKAAEKQGEAMAKALGGAVDKIIAARDAQPAPPKPAAGRRGE